MSARYLNWAAKVPIEATLRTRVRVRAVLRDLADACGPEGLAFRSVATMASRTGLGERSVQKSLRELEAQGLIEAVGGVSRGGRALSTRYRLRVHENPAEQSETPHSVRGFDSLETPHTEHETPHTEHETPHTVRPIPQRTREDPANLLGALHNAPARAAKQSRSASAPDPQLEAARALLDPWWRAQHPRPQQPYIAAAKVIARALRDGWTDADVTAMLHDRGTPISGGVLDLWRRTRNGPVSQPQRTADTVMAALDRRLRIIRGEDVR